MTPPPTAEASAESLADLVYRPRLAAPGWSPSRRSQALQLSVLVYAGVLLLVVILLRTATPPPTTLPKVVTVDFTTYDEAAPAPRVAPSRQAPSPSVPVPAALPSAPTPSLETPTALPTQQAPAPAPAAASPAASGSTAGATAPRFDAAYLQNPQPDYPAVSRRIGEEGRVILRVLVSAEGRAEEVEVRTSSGSSRLDQAALASVKRWRFEPARQGAQAVPAWVLVPISFHLDA